MSIRDQLISCLETYQANGFSKGLRECIENVDGRVKPLCQPIIGGSRSIEFLYLLLKHVENGAGRLAGLELGCEWMGEKVVLGFLFVGFQGVTKNKLEAW